MASKKEKMNFRSKMVLWVAANGIPADVLDGPLFKMPLENKDPVWVWDELVRESRTRDTNGNRDWQTDRNKLELMMFARAK